MLPNKIHGEWLRQLRAHDNTRNPCNIEVRLGGKLALAPSGALILAAYALGCSVRLDLCYVEAWSRGGQPFCVIRADGRLAGLPTSVVKFCGLGNESPDAYLPKEQAQNILAEFGAKPGPHMVRHEGASVAFWLDGLTEILPKHLLITLVEKAEDFR